ncbi:MAG: ParB/RepB/Spo0J family partition protein [Bacteroidota bacterium]|nr:ParB/RepB/Spo0J family partition protein [Bacteroidota bacterium]MDX5429825.1 ParB/RepB/Spo0J family partition protein [Bacteroidota bacterium]MDX5468604.1 ParB/RepB/Spo0J family partition protein [Bacteroidota bacterium]
MTKTKKPALGKGLSALLKDASTDITSSGVKPVGGISMIRLNEIQANPFQPRAEFDQTALDELAESIKVHGVIQPITVRKLGYDQYQIISGERRTRASILAGLTEIPAYVRIANDQDMLEMALIENIQRENLNAMEVAFSYQRLMEECKLKMEELGERVGKNRSTVNNYLRLLKLPNDIQVAIRVGALSMGHARALIAIEDPDRQMEVFAKTLENDLSVRDVEALARELKPGKEKKSKTVRSNGKNADYAHFTERINDIADKYDVPVKVRPKEIGGEIVMVFNSEEELQKLLDLL